MLLLSLLTFSVTAGPRQFRTGAGEVAVLIMVIQVLKTVL